MIIFNLRLGFACNSSSTHSLIFINSDARVQNPSEDRFFFGWDRFLLQDPASKLDYAAVQLFHHFRVHKKHNKKYSKFLVESIIPEVDVPIDDEEYIGVDHQSSVYFPDDFDGSSPNLEFINEYVNFLKSSSRIVVYGGNDNEPGEHKNIENLSYAQFPFPMTSGDTIARKDRTYNFWTVFSRHTGNKWRVTFEDISSFINVYPRWRVEHPLTFNFDRSELPELVDLKITDYCPFDCPFCYQGSTRQGAHADYWHIYVILRALSDAKVFEVAFGGGEPTLHPDFLGILETAHSFGIVPNFTTKNKNFIAENRKVINEYVGAFAFSVGSQKEMVEVLELVDKNQIFRDKLNFQIVMGTVERDVFNQMMAFARSHRVRVTLLGFKTTHRGDGYEIIDYDWWFADLKKLAKDSASGRVSVGVDTSMIKQFPELFKKEFPSFLYTANEGTFSCYIDAVNLKIAPSSFCDLSEYKDYSLEYREDSTEYLKELFGSLT